MELDELRAYACRLDPKRALTTVDEAEAWVRERGVVEGTPHCSLPSLHVAIHEAPYEPGSRGFGLYPVTKWWWVGELAGRRGLWRLPFHRGKALLLSEEVARLASPLARAALAEAEAGSLGELEQRLVRHLAEVGPAEVGDLRAELSVESLPFRTARKRLERVGAVVSRGVVLEPHAHSSVLSRWDQAFPEETSGGLDALLVECVRAAVVAPERELARWLTWPLPPGAVEQLVADGRLRRLEEGMIAT